MRFRFDPRAKYAGRLESVSRRPIENRDGRVALLRLEFLIYRINDTWLETKGQIACRDVILGPDLEDDPGIRRLADALKITSPLSEKAWLVAPERKPWITIRFGEPSPTDQRQPFDEIQTFRPDGRELKRRGPPETDGRWATTGEAAIVLGVSENTVRRRVDSLKEEFGEILIIQHRPKGHRRINILLLRALIQSSARGRGGKPRRRGSDATPPGARPVRRRPPAQSSGAEGQERMTRASKEVRSPSSSS